MGPLAILAYVVLALIVMWSSLKNRRKGWIFGLIFGILLLTLPLWIIGLIWIFGAWPG
jgi:hypothetical protein